MIDRSGWRSSRGRDPVRRRPRGRAMLERHRDSAVHPREEGLIHRPCSTPTALWSSVTDGAISATSPGGVREVCTGNDERGRSLLVQRLLCFARRVSHSNDAAAAPSSPSRPGRGRPRRILDSPDPRRAGPPRRWSAVDRSGTWGGLCEIAPAAGQASVRICRSH